MRGFFRARARGPLDPSRFARVVWGSLLVSLLLTGCLESPFAPPPTLEGRCVAEKHSRFGCGDTCVGLQVETSVSCASTLEGRFDASGRVCRFDDGTLAVFATPLPRPGDRGDLTQPFGLEIRRGDGSTCLDLRISPPPAAEAGLRETQLLVGDTCFRQRERFQSKGDSLVLDEVEVLCGGELRSAQQPELCGACADSDCAKLPLLRVEVSEQKGLVLLRLVAGDRQTQLFSCRR